MYVELPSVLHLGIRDIRHAAVAGEELARVLDTRHEREHAGGDVVVGAHLRDSFHEFKTVYRTGARIGARSATEKTNAWPWADSGRRRKSARRKSNLQGSAGDRERARGKRRLQT